MTMIVRPRLMSTLGRACRQLPEHPAVGDYLVGTWTRRRTSAPAWMRPAGAWRVDAEYPGPLGSTGTRSVARRSGLRTRSSAKTRLMLLATPLGPGPPALWLRQWCPLSRRKRPGRQPPRRRQRCSRWLCRGSHRAPPIGRCPGAGGKKRPIPRTRSDQSNRGKRRRRYG